MKYLLNLFVFSSVLSLSGNAFAMPEIPFCPGGGPPGWFNHFNYKRDQNIWHHQNAYHNMAEYRYYNAPARPALNYQNHRDVNLHYPAANRSPARDSKPSPPLRQYYQSPAQPRHYIQPRRLSSQQRNR